MSTDVAKRPEIVDYRTGEVLDPRDTERVAGLVEHLRDAQRQIREAINLCTEALLEEMKVNGTGTLRVGDLTVERGGGPELEWNVEILEELLAAGLPDERFAQLVKIVQTFKVDARVAKQLESNPDYAEIIDRARSRVEKPYRISVKRK